MREMPITSSCLNIKNYHKPNYFISKMTINFSHFILCQNQQSLFIIKDLSELSIANRNEKHGTVKSEVIRHVEKIIQ